MKIKDFRYCRPIQKDIRQKDLAAFDIETYGSKNKFLCGSIVYDEGKLGQSTDRELTVKYFDEQKDMINYFKTYPRFRHTGHWTFAHNLYFDLTGILKDTDEIQNLNPLELHGSFIKATWKINEKDKIQFYDTFSHAKITVERMGEILGIPKLEKPSFLGKKPLDKEEWQILKEYNIRDSLVCLRFAEFLQKNYNKLGCNIKLTLPSTAMDLYRRKYQKEIIMQPPLWVIKKQYDAMRGGRTEVIRRGKISNCRMYDVRSMYPSQMMTREFPLPNSILHKEYSKYGWRDKNIMEREGVSHVEMTAPYIHIPYLPVRKNNKLLFPYGFIRGWYTHYEIREAIKLGYELHRVRETFYYTKTHKPFRDFVTDIYAKRMENWNNPSLKLFYKILMNSLFGKFAQKVDRGIQVRPLNTFSSKELQYYINNETCKIDFLGDWVYLNQKDPRYFATYINPIYSIYITAYARDWLFKLKPPDTYYMDTDSFITKKNMDEDCGMMLGELELQEEINEGILVRPKMYEVNGKLKIKGAPKAKELMQIINSKTYKYYKMSKYRESIKRKFDFNQIIKVEKHFSLEDDKRNWNGQRFDPDELQESEPIKLTVKDY